MKHMISILIEELMMLLYIGHIVLFFPEYVPSLTVPVVIVLALGAAILLAGIYEAAVCERVCSAGEHSNPSLVIIVELIHNILVFGSFFLAFVAIRHYGHLRASTRTLLLCGVGSTFYHMSFGFLISTAMEKIHNLRSRK